MQNTDTLHDKLMGILRDKLGEQMDKYLFPPPVFVDMQGEFVDFSLEAGWLTTKFPILDRYRNPYGSMQGGMLAAAVDNTLGPLSVVVAPINVTRTLEMKYSRPVMPEMGFILVKAQLVKRQDPKLFFEAAVGSPDGQRLAKCKAVHWIIADQSA
jgi:acyl-coenzyme A thioesterase PaaI-like protein